MEETGNGEDSSKKLTLNQSIDFLEKLEETKALAGKDNEKGDNNVGTIRKLKAINIISTIGIVFTFLLLFWVIGKLRNSRKE